MTTNLDRLRAFTLRVIDEADGRADAPRLLRMNAEKIRAMMSTVDIALAFDRSVPEHLEGISCFDFAESAETLETAAHRAEIGQPIKTDWFSVAKDVVRPL